MSAQKFFYKLFFGKPEYNKPLRISAYQGFVRNFLQIWNNDYHHDIGFEKLIRLFLVGIQIIFPGIHVIQVFGNKTLVARIVVKELYVIGKTLLELYFLSSGLYHNKVILWISVYLLSETICYVAALIFVSDMFVKPRSYRRNILMLFFNYMEICFCFAVLYDGLNLLRGNITNYVDYVYFSIVTSTTIGFGDMTPNTQLGKVFVSAQAIIAVAFVGLFLNFFGSKVENLHSPHDL